jgi:hypothetical protein
VTRLRAPAVGAIEGFLHPGRVEGETRDRGLGGWASHSAPPFVRPAGLWGELGGGGARSRRLRVGLLTRGPVDDEQAQHGCTARDG